MNKVHHFIYKRICASFETGKTIPNRWFYFCGLKLNLKLFEISFLFIQTYKQYKLFWYFFLFKILKTQNWDFRFCRIFLSLFPTYWVSKVSKINTLSAGFRFKIPVYVHSSKYCCQTVRCTVCTCIRICTQTDMFPLPPVRVRSVSRGKFSPPHTLVCRKLGYLKLNLLCWIIEMCALPLCRLHRNRRYEDWGRASSLGRASS